MATFRSSLSGVINARACVRVRAGTNDPCEEENARTAEVCIPPLLETGVVAGALVHDEVVVETPLATELGSG